MGMLCKSPSRGQQQVAYISGDGYAPAKGGYQIVLKIMGKGRRNRVKTSSPTSVRDDRRNEAMRPLANTIRDKGERNRLNPRGVSYGFQQIAAEAVIALLPPHPQSQWGTARGRWRRICGV